MAHILVIDDDAFFREFLCRLLAAEGHETARADSVAAADAMALGAEFDLVFLDVRLPDGTGLDLLPRLRAAADEVIAGPAHDAPTLAPSPAGAG